MEKIYRIEENGNAYFGSCQYRFYSLYNGARGAWYDDEKKAIEEGEAHQKIILSLYTRGMQYVIDEFGKKG